MDRGNLEGVELFDHSLRVFVTTPLWRGCVDDNVGQIARNGDKATQLGKGRKVESRSANRDQSKVGGLGCLDGGLLDLAGSVDDGETAPPCRALSSILESMKIWQDTTAGFSVVRCSDLDNGRPFPGLDALCDDFIIISNTPPNLSLLPTRLLAATQQVLYNCVL
jgi:hypothetical protein